MEVLKAYDWPGNVRELSNAIERAMVVGKKDSIQPEDLPLARRAGNSGGDALALEAIERRHIGSVLEQTDWNITRAAELLEIDRATVYNKIRKYDLKQ
jgi:transcriptional regulator of acetoin/glycerol metabolism